MISIIIPVFNRAGLLPATIESVICQTFLDFEIIAVDDGSTDGSYEWLLELAQKEKNLIVTKNNSGIKGPSAARNVGLKSATGKYIIFLDSDDLLEPFCLAQRVKAMEREHHLDYAVFQQYIFEIIPSEIKGIFNRYPFGNDSFLAMFIRNDNPWQTMGVIWRKSTLVKLGGFDTGFLVMEDPELHTRALLDPSLQFGVYKDLPPDNLYRINHIDGDKSETFYRDSILYRFLYLKKINRLVDSSVLTAEKKKSINENWIKGVNNLFRNFLLARITSYQSETLQFLDWAAETGALRKWDLLKFNLAIKIWRTHSVFVRKMRLRGIFSFLFFK